ncbi:MAG: acyl-CoA dehydrogenase family protein [Candidatus Thiodiazotropha sp. (ex Rostrolucina anterorostrata)]|nr:acyl-CoA dehydrogenase family protein [Candidatus Thiodiazotropha sp. (ex Rostrolucina anterorostrata)]
MALASVAYETDVFEETLNAAIELNPVIKTYREQIESERRLPLELVDTLKQAGMFKMTMPKEWGGSELDPITQIKVIETLSEADASVGWCVMIGGDNGYFSSFIDQSAARDMFKDVSAVTGSALSQTGRAVKVDGGYNISGRWPFSSGCQHSTWLLGGCKVYDGDTLRLRPGDIPETRQVFLPADKATILDTWHTLGLRGSGSNDFTIENYFVPEEQTFSFQELKVFNPNPLYRFPMAFMFNFAAVPIGTAQAAMTALIEAAEKPSRQVTLNGRFVPVRQLREESFVQDAVGRASAMIGAARAYLYSVVEDIWRTIQSGRDPSPIQAAQFQSMNVQVFGMCLKAVELVFKARGGSSVYSGSVLETCLRDLQTMDQHVMSSLRTYAQSGRILMGLPPEEILL